MTHYINTIEDFYKIKDNLQPVYITSKKHGKILVPCANTILVKRELIQANTYNPNNVPREKMDLLKESILDNGFCFPVVTIFDHEIECFVIIDGFHRDSLGDVNWLDLDYIPLVILNHDISKRMAATWQFNKARGIHQVDMDAELIRGLIDQGLSKLEITDKLGIDLDTVERYASLTGYAYLFKKQEYSMSWEMINENDNE